MRGHIRYTEKEVRQQIEAALKLGIDEFMIWNAVNRYQPASFLPPEKAQALEDRINRQRKEGNQDALGRTPAGAMEAYLEAVAGRNWRETYSLQSTGFAMDHEAHREWFNGWTGRLRSHALKDRGEAAGTHGFAVDMTISVNRVAYELEGVPFEVFLENQIWRVKPGEVFLDKLTYEASGEEDPPEE